MARTPLAGTLQQIAAQASTDAGTAPRPTRRQLLAGSAGIAAAAAAARFAPVARAADSPRIVVVGAGLAGLSCAYRLKQAGYTAQVYEGSDRLGGRCWSDRTSFANGQVVEHGGELIDQGHTAIRQLASELGLKLDNLLTAERNGTEPFYYFDGQPYSEAEAVNDIKAIWQQLHADASAASYPTLYNLSTERGRVLDKMSIADWIAAYVPGGRASKLGQLLDVAYNIEYGAEATEQSSLNMIYLLAYRGMGNLRIFGASNEKYHVVGGNDQIPAAMASALSGQITLGSELTAIRRNSDGSWGLSFRGGRSVTADRVVIAIPFSILRSSVDISKAGFSPRKLTAIRDMGMGTNSKLHVQFTSRHWESLGCNGDTFADTGYQNTWDVTRAQPGTSGILVDYTGGTIGASFGTGTPSSRAEQFLGQLEPVLPGISARWNGRALIDYWTGNRWTKGSYSYWKVGQYQAFAGVEREIEGGSCHFAGEHTSIDFQGYLNGAVETGERAAGEITAALK
jgi:monoamine oxidase